MNSGIIAEYNPFHNGHKLHIQKTKSSLKNNSVIIAMSGNFVQRGEPAILDKFIRTKTALNNGADIVLEIPSIYSTAAADIFARAAIDLLDKTGIVDYLSFGTETGNLNEFELAADLLSNENKKFKTLLKSELKKGISYPNARQNALNQCLAKDFSYLKSPNNILALEYLKSLKILKSCINPFTIKREYAGFNDTEIYSEIASATAIRLAIQENRISEIEKCVPEDLYKQFTDNFKLPYLNNYSDILHYLLRTTSLSELSEILDITEGLENRILDLSTNQNITDLINSVKTKRYTYSKIQRAILHIILDIKKSDICLETPNKYIRVLGFRKSASNIISELTEKSKLPVIINLKNDINNLSLPAKKMLEKEINVNNIYHLPLTGKKNLDYTEKVVILNDF